MKQILYAWTILFFFTGAVFSATNTQIITVDPPLTLTNGLMEMPKSSAIQDGYLSAVDFAIFAAGGGGGGSGTVTSVGLSLPNIFTVSNSPVTTSGTLTGVLASQTQNKFLGSPNGSTGTPSFRALVAADVPTLNQNTTGTASNITGTSNSTLATLSALTSASSLATIGTISGGIWNGTVIDVPYGGTGIASGTSGGIPYFSGTTTIASSGALTANAIMLGGGVGTTPTVMGSLGTTTTLLHGNASGAPTFGAVSLTADITGTLPIANGGTNGGTANAGFNNLSPMSALGDIIYGGASGAGTALSGNTTSTKKFLSQTGSGVVSAAPAWATIIGSDLPNPSSSTLGGVQSAAAVTNQWINSISTSGVPALSQPAFSNISGTAAVTQGGTGLTVGTSGGIPYFSSTTAISSSGALTANQLVLGGGAGTTPACLGSLGTTTTLLHGNASGAPTFGAVSLTADVSGTLPVANGGTGVTSSTGTGSTVLSASPTLTGTAVLASATVSGTLKNGNCVLSATETDIGNTGSSQSIDLSTGNVWTGTLNASSTFTFSNPVAGCPYVFVLTQGSGGQTLTTAGVTTIWGNTGSKTLSTASGAIDKVSCVYNGALSKLMCDLSNAYQ